MCHNILYEIIECSCSLLYFSSFPTFGIIKNKHKMYVLFFLPLFTRLIIFLSGRFSVPCKHQTAKNKCILIVYDLRTRRLRLFLNSTARAFHFFRSHKLCLLTHFCYCSLKSQSLSDKTFIQFKDHVFY